jgi:hypothetical protein
VWSILWVDYRRPNRRASRRAGERREPNRRKNSSLRHSKRYPLALVRARRSLVPWLGGERIASGASGEINDRAL